MSAELEHLRQQVLQLMSAPSFVPQRKRRIAKQLGVDDEDYVDFRHMLEDMSERGEIAELKHGKFGLHPERDQEAKDFAHGGPRVKPNMRRGGVPKQLASHRVPKNARVGRIEIKRGGFGFLLSDPPGDDLYIAQEDLGGALSGDLVAVVPKGGHQGRRQGRRWFASSGKKSTGSVVDIIERAHSKLVGTFYERTRTKHDTPGGLGGYIVPDTRGVFGEIEVLPADRGAAQSGDKVAVELIEPEKVSHSGKLPSGRVVKVYGGADEAQAAIAAVIDNFDLRIEFSEGALQQAARIPESISEEERARRVDYTSPVTFTIDPEDAKDHDDAVALRNLGEGKTELLVHIADVAHYVTLGSPIDLEARERATSVYLPGQVLPMLPHQLSNHMCSLKEGQLRLTLTCAITFSKSMIPLEWRIERSYIRSAAFLTYDRVKQAIDAEDPSQLPSQEIFDALKAMKGFAAALRRKRLDAGSIDLDLPKVKLLFDEHGAVTGWQKEESHWAHQLVEDFMLSANRVVAEYLVEHEIPGLFRIHEDPEPESLEQFARFAREFGLGIRPPYDRPKLRHVLDRVRGKEYQHAVHLALLTSLKQAHYSAECLPHFALAFTRYLHFTSPIRRYPDLIVHRALSERFAPGERVLPQHGKKRKGGEQADGHFARLADLRGLAVHTSARERTAARAEEEVKKFRQIQYLKQNLKEGHPGVVTGVRDFGIFVELQDCYVEGLVRVQDLGDDYYEYFEDQHLLQGRKQGRAFRLGDKVVARVVHIDIAQKKVGLVLV